MESCEYLVENLEHYNIKADISFWRENNKQHYVITGVYKLGLYSKILFCFDYRNEDEKEPVIDLDTLKEMNLTFDATVQVINLIDSLKSYCMDFWGSLTL